jgi:hypothetical protein
MSRSRLALGQFARRYQGLTTVPWIIRRDRHDQRPVDHKDDSGWMVLSFANHPAISLSTSLRFFLSGLGTSIAESSISSAPASAPSSSSSSFTLASDFAGRPRFLEGVPLDLLLASTLTVAFWRSSLLESSTWLPWVRLWCRYCQPRMDLAVPGASSWPDGTSHGLSFQSWIHIIVRVG